MTAAACAARADCAGDGATCACAGAPAAAVVDAGAGAVAGAAGKAGCERGGEEVATPGTEKGALLASGCSPSSLPAWVQWAGQM